MRTPLPLRSSLAAAALAAGGLFVAAGATSAAAPPTDPGDIDYGQLVAVLTPEQITCIGSQFTTELTTDPDAAIQVLTDCGVTTEQLASLMPGADPVSSSEAGSDDSVVDEAADPAAVAAVLAAAGLDATDLTCIGAGLDAAVTGDDAGALTILQGCGVSLVALLQGLVTAGETAPVPAVDTPATTVAGPTTGDPVNDMVTSMLSSMGIEMSPEQISCLTEAVTAGGVDTADQGALMNLLAECGISLTDMMPSS